MPQNKNLSPESISFIETKRLLLRPFVPADCQRLVEIFGDHRVAKWVDDGGALSEEKANRWIAASISSIQKNGTSAGAVIEKSTQRMIGWGGIVHPHDALPEIIYGFEFSAWGKGYGTELATAIVRDCFTAHHFDSICASIDPENNASAKILKSLGFELISSDLDENGLPTDTYRLET